MHPALGRLLVALPSFALGAGVALLISAWSSDATRASEATQMQARLSEARLAVEEAELRERVMTALAVAEGVRLRGRTVLIAVSELQRVRESLAKLDPLAPDRRRLEERLATLDARRREVAAALDEEFLTYLEVVAELGSDLWPRFRRVSGKLEEELIGRRLGRLAELLPMLRVHVETFSKAGGASAEDIEKWRLEVDDTLATRRSKLAGAADREQRDVDAPAPGDQDI